MSRWDFLEGAVDMHVHSAPDLDPRRYDDLELAREAARAGMGALLLKSHLGSTVERAYLVSQVVREIKVHGSIVLNEPVGGLNPAAVRVALELGAREVWMPTRSAANHRRHHGQAGGLTVVDDCGGIVPEVEEILRLIAARQCILGSGHLAPEETVALVKRAKELGVGKVLITHPEWSATFYPIELQRQLAALGGVFFERCYVSTTHRCGFTPFPVIEDAIAAVGVETTVISTDLGQVDTPAPVDGLRLYADRLLSSGFTREQIREMARELPFRLLMDGAH
ncbi:MAG: DUF6282 family protein [Bryobacteraceae bacterium]